MPLLFVITYRVGLVPNVASNLWSDHLKKRFYYGDFFHSHGQDTVFWLFGSICAAAIEISKNKPQSSFMKLTSVIIIFSNHILNAFGVALFYLAIPPLHMVPLQALLTLVFPSFSCQCCLTWNDGFMLG